MADLSFTQGADPVEVANSTSGNIMAVNADGSINTIRSITGKVYVATANFTGIGTTELDEFLFKNGSSKTVTIRQIILTDYKTTTAYIQYQFYVSPTITTNGSSITITPFALGSGNSPTATCFSGPTISAKGTKFFDLGSTSLESTNSLVYEPVGLTLAINTNFLITAVADGTLRSGQVTIVWEEN